MRKYQTAKELTEGIVPEYPARWDGWYEEIASEYEKNGCRWTKKETYQALEKEFACFGEELELYCQAAEECGKSEQLTLILMLMERSLADRVSFKEDLSRLGTLKSPEPDKPLAYRMLTGLAAATQVEASAALLRRRGFDAERISRVLNNAVSAVGSYRRLNNGLDGFNLLDWVQLYFDGKLYSIDLFEVEFLGHFDEEYTVFKNSRGEIKVLKAADGFTGFECRDGAVVSEEKLSLDSAEWSVALKGGDDVIGLHIPRGHRLEKEAIDRSLKEILRFAGEHFPELNCKAFVCESWLLSADLSEILDNDTNIVRFSEMFYRYAVSGKGEAVFNFVFCLPMSRVKIAELPENTRLERALKKRYADGKSVREMSGFMLI